MLDDWKQTSELNSKIERLKFLETTPSLIII